MDLTIMSTTAVTLIGLAGVVLALLALRRHSGSQDLGSVSRVWIIEHRPSSSDHD